MPAWGDFSEEEQARVIRSRDGGAKVTRDPGFSETVEHGVRMYVEQGKELESSLVGYVRLLVSLLGRAGIGLSPRRAGMLLRNILAVHAANCLPRFGVSLKDSALLAVTHSLPQKAQGIRVDQVKLLAAHREAWNAAQISEDDPVRAVWLHNMSVPTKTTITRNAPSHRVYGHGVVVALPENFRAADPIQLLKVIGGKKARKESADHALRRLIETRARELPLPPAVAITGQARHGDIECIDLITIVTVLAKSSSRVYLRDKEPNLPSIVAGRRIVLLLPREVRL